MKPVGILLLTVAVVGGLWAAWLRSSADEPERRDAAAPPAPSEAEVDERTPATLAGGNETPTRTVESVEPQREDPVAVEPAIEEPAWFVCHTAADDDAFRACLERELPPDGLPPEELARWLCSGEWWTRFPETDPLVLAEVAIPRWPVDGFFTKLDYVLGRCSSEANLDRWWAAFLRDMEARDAAWVQGLRGALTGDVLFDPKTGTLALETAFDLCGDGACPRLESLLQDGARGLLGGSDEQVARALEASWRGLEGASERLAFLESVVASPEFEARDFETDALIGLVLHPDTIPGGDTGSPIGLARRILSDPTLGPGAAEHLTILAEWDRLPAAYTVSEREELMALAASVLDLPAGNR